MCLLHPRCVVLAGAKMTGCLIHSHQCKGCDSLSISCYSDSCLTIKVQDICKTNCWWQMCFYSLQTMKICINWDTFWWLKTSGCVSNLTHHIWAGSGCLQVNSLCEEQKRQNTLSEMHRLSTLDFICIDMKIVVNRDYPKSIIVCDLCNKIN